MLLTGTYKTINAGDAEWINSVTSMFPIFWIFKWKNNIYIKNKTDKLILKQFLLIGITERG